MKARREARGRGAQEVRVSLGTDGSRHSEVSGDLLSVRAGLCGGRWGR